VKRVSCWLGRHTWATTVEKGESHMACTACGKTPRGKRGNIEGAPHDYFGWRTKSPPMRDDP
jgi:hypothetical protein